VAKLWRVIDLEQDEAHYYDRAVEVVFEWDDDRRLCNLTKSQLEAMQVFETLDCSDPVLRPGEDGPLITRVDDTGDRFFRVSPGYSWNTWRSMLDERPAEMIGYEIVFQSIPTGKCRDEVVFGRRVRICSQDVNSAPDQSTTGWIRAL